MRKHSSSEAFQLPPSFTRPFIPMASGCFLFFCSRWNSRPTIAPGQCRCLQVIPHYTRIRYDSPFTNYFIRLARCSFRFISRETGDARFSHFFRFLAPVR